MKKTKNFEPKKPKEIKDMVIVEGTVVEAFANAMFNVLLDNGNIIKCTVAGKMRKIRVNPDDRVQVGISIYNTEVGRIIYNYK